MSASMVVSLVAWQAISQLQPWCLRAAPDVLGGWNSARLVQGDGGDVNSVSAFRLQQACCERLILWRSRPLPELIQTSGMIV